jgi:hypothetical protein
MGKFLRNKTIFFESNFINAEEENHEMGCLCNKKNFFYSKSSLEKFQRKNFLLPVTISSLSRFH